MNAPFALKPGITLEQYQEQVVDSNRDPYGRRIVEYAQDVASQLDKLLEDGASDTLPQRLAAQLEGVTQACDTDGITGFMYGAAIHLLADYWVHGEVLRQIHNARYNQPQAEGTINPALLQTNVDLTRLEHAGEFYRPRR